jgi:hypothetical protein
VTLKSGFKKGDFEMLKQILTAAATAGVMAIQVQAVTLFEEDFEKHNVGHGMNGINGWSSVGNPNIAEVLVNNIPGLLDGNFGDGSFRFTPSDGGKHVNSAGIAGGMDPTKEYRLRWTWKNLGDSSSAEFGFGHINTLGGTHLTMEGNFNGAAGRMRLRAMGGGEDGAGWPGDGAVNDYVMVINSNNVQLWRDGFQVSGAPMDAVTMAGHNEIYWWIDTSANRDNGQIDSIVVSDSTPENIQPVTITTGVVDNVVRFEFESQAGFDYTVECSANLVDWAPISTFQGQGGTESVPDPTGSDSDKVYRVVEGQ